MDPAVESVFRPSFRLLRGGCNEERVAGLLISAKLFDSLMTRKEGGSSSTSTSSPAANPVGPDLKISRASSALRSDPSQAVKLLGEIIDRVTPKFLVRLLCSTLELISPNSAGSSSQSSNNGIDALGEGGSHLRAAVTQLLEAVVRLRDNDLAQKFSLFSDQLITAYLQGKIDFDALQVVFMPASGRSALCKKCLTSALSDDVIASKSLDFSRVFRLIDRALHKMSSKNTSIALSSAEASALRGVIIRACSGGTAHGVRDAAITTLFSCLHRLDMKWTIEASQGNKSTSTSINSKSTSSNDDKKKENPLGSFAAFIAGVVCGEVRILYEELLALLAATVPASSEAQSAASASMPEDRRPGSIERCEQLSTACFAIVDAVIAALIGRPEDEEAGVDPAWAALPPQMLLQIQKSLRALIEGYFEFLKEVRGLCQEFEAIAEASRPDGFITIRKVVVSVIRRSQMSIIQIALEDPDFAVMCMSNIDDMLYYSEVEVTKDSLNGSIVSRLCGISSSSATSSSIASNISTIDTFQSLLPLALQAVSESSLDIDLGNRRPGTTTNTSSNTSTNDNEEDDGALSVPWDDDVMALLGSGPLLSRLVLVASDSATFVEAYCKNSTSNSTSSNSTTSSATSTGAARVSADAILEVMATGNMAACLLSKLLQFMAHTGMKNLLFEKHISSLSLDMSNMVQRVTTAMKCKFPKGNSPTDREIYMSFLEFQEEMKSLVGSAKQLVREL